MTTIREYHEIFGIALMAFSVAWTYYAIYDYKRQPKDDLWKGYALARDLGGGLMSLILGMALYFDAI
jgi:hypothetical protein